MILINLLPHRERARQHQRHRFHRRLGALVLLGAGVCVSIFVGYQKAIERQQARNQMLMTAIAELEREIQHRNRLEKDLANLRARRLAFEQRQDERNQPVHLLQELVLQLPDGVVLGSLQQDRQRVVITGTARSHERVSEVMRKLSSSERLGVPALVEVTATPQKPGVVAAGPARRAAAFTIWLTPESAAAAGGAAAVPRGG